MHVKKGLPMETFLAIPAVHLLVTTTQLFGALKRIHLLVNKLVPTTLMGTVEILSL